MPRMAKPNYVVYYVRVRAASVVPPAAESADVSLHPSNLPQFSRAHRMSTEDHEDILDQEDYVRVAAEPSVDQ